MGQKMETLESGEAVALNDSIRRLLDQGATPAQVEQMFTIARDGVLGRPELRASILNKRIGPDETRMEFVLRVSRAANFLGLSELRSVDVQNFGEQIADLFVE